MTKTTAARSSTPPASPTAATATTSTPVNPILVHEENFSCPYCYIRSRNKKKLQFSANAASIKMSTNSKNSVSRPVASADVPGSPTPMINIRVKTSNKTLSTLRSLPDTGASIDCVDANFVMKHKIEMIPDTTHMIELISAEGKSMKVLGTCRLAIQNIGGYGYTHNVALVSPNLSH